MIDPYKIKAQFPFFTNNPNIIYLDSAATTQKPQRVLNVLNEFYGFNNANSGRGSYKLSSQLATKVETIRSSVADFIGASPQEVIFNSGASAGFNQVVMSLAFNYLKDGDEILYSEYDHKSFILPWVLIKDQLQKFGISIKLIPYKIRMTGGADIDDILSKVSSKTKVVNITHINNIFGSDSDIYKLNHLREKGIVIHVDATQSIGHINVDVKKLGADILSFSGHKMFAAQGVGITYISKWLHDHLKSPIVGGGEAVQLKENKLVVNTFNKSFEAGTLNYAGVLSLGEAINFIQDLGIEHIHSHLIQLTQYLLTELKLLPKIKFNKGAYYWKCFDGFGIISFDIDGISNQDIGFILGEHGIYVRSGTHCSTLADDSSDSIRVSLHVYNTKEDIDILISVLKKM